MFNLYDIMQTAQQGQAARNIADQFGLSVEQTRKAMEAMLPAFALGLQRATQNQQSLLNTMGLMGSGQFAPFFEQAAATRSPAAPAQGANVVETLFGSPEVTRQVAAHAAVLSGVKPEVLLRMLPLMGAMIMGGLFKTAVDQGMGQLMAQSAEFMQRAGGVARPQPKSAAPPANPTADAADMFGQIVANSLKAMFNVFPTAPEPAKETPPAPAAAPPPPPQPEPPRAAAPGQAPPAAAAHASDAEPGDAFDPAKSGMDHLTRMFETGRTVQDQQLAALRTIFDSFAPADKGTGKPD